MSLAGLNGNNFTQGNKFPELKVPGNVGGKGAKGFCLFQLQVSFPLTKTIT